MAVKSNFFFWLDNVKQIFSSETAWPNEAKLGRKHLCKVLYKLSLFRSVWPANMATESNPLKLLGQIKPNLAGSIYRFLLYIPRRVFHLFLFSNRGRALYNWTNSSHIFPDRIWLFVYGKMMFLFGKPVLFVGFFDNTVSKETLQWVFMNSNLPANHFTVQWLVSHFHHCQFFKYRKS